MHNMARLKILLENPVRMFPANMSARAVIKTIERYLGHHFYWIKMPHRYATENTQDIEDLTRVVISYEIYETNREARFINFI